MAWNDKAPAEEVDLLVAGLGPGGCAAALAARAAGLRTLAVEARGPEATRAQLILLRPGAQAALQRLGLPDVTQGRRTTTIRHVENRLREALMAAADASAQALQVRWHTGVSALQLGPESVQITVRDAHTGAEQVVSARHVIDATGGRLEALGRPARERAGPAHVVATAEYSVPPWFDGIVGVHDRRTHELCMLFPTWGRRGVIAYLDSHPGPGTDPARHVQRFQALADSLGLGEPQYPLTAVDVHQRALPHPTDDRVLPIGDSVGNVDVLWGAGASSAIEDGAEAALAIAEAQRSATPAAEQALTAAACRRIFARHRAIIRRGRIVLAVRPILERAWPAAALPQVRREDVGPPPLLWPAVRLAFGRRPQPR